MNDLHLILVSLGALILSPFNVWVAVLFVSLYPVTVVSTKKIIKKIKKD